MNAVIAAYVLYIFVDYVFTHNCAGYTLLRNVLESRAVDLEIQIQNSEVLTPTSIIFTEKILSNMLLSRSNDIKSQDFREDCSLTPHTIYP